MKKLLICILGFLASQSLTANKPVAEYAEAKEVSSFSTVIPNERVIFFEQTDKKTEELIVEEFAHAVEVEKLSVLETRPQRFVKIESAKVFEYEVLTEKATTVEDFDSFLKDLQQTQPLRSVVNE